MIKDYGGFCVELLKAGFSVGGGNDEGVFSLLKQHGDSSLRYHTGDPETDPWEWRMRVLNERSDIAYSKVFFRKTGYITREWYPYFLAVRRGGRMFEEDYESGTISHFAKRIYEAVTENGRLALEEIKRVAGFSREEKSKFDTALTELQMRFYLTMCGEQRKVSVKGEEYGWPSTMFCAPEMFWSEDVFTEAARIGADEALAAIEERVLELNPLANEKKIVKFIKG